MARRDLEARLARLEERGSELTGAPLQPASPTHLQTFVVLGNLFALADHLNTGDTPPWLKTMMTLMRKGGPRMAAELADVPPEKIKQFMAGLIEQMQTIVDAPDTFPAPTAEVVPDDVNDAGATPDPAGGHIASTA